MSKAKVIAAVGVVAVIVVVLAVYLAQQDNPDTVRIGAILPMTGQAAGYGKWMQRGIALAVDDINAEGGIGGKKLEVIVEDSKSDNRAGADAANKLVGVDRVPAIITALTGVTQSVAPVTERNRIVLFTLAVAPGLTDDKAFVFRNITNVANEVARMVSACKDELHLKRVTLIHINNPPGLWVAEHFRKQMEAIDGEVPAVESFQPDTTDFRTQLTRMKSSDPDALYILGYQQNGLIMKQARELGLKCQFLGITDCELPEVIRIAGDAAEGVVYTKAAFDLTDKGAAEFAAKYTARFGEPPEVYGATSYDAVRMIAMAIAKGDGDPAALRTLILSIKDYPGVSGVTTFLPNGDVQKPVELKKIEHGQFVPFSR
ncbi:MAG: ABC transporter substrate-binding protein [Phycisphaerae bacterium]